MMSFLLCLLQYLLIMAVLAAIAFAGGSIGIKLRKKKDEKNSAPDKEK